MPDSALPALPAAVLWDMDGTLVDTEPAWLATERALVEAHGGLWTHEDAQKLIGTAIPDAALILQEHGVDLPRDEIVERLLDGVTEVVRGGVAWQPGARTLLADLADAGVPCALVTMSFRRFAEAAMSGLPEGAFAVVVTGDEVTRGKPHPEPYLRAAELLGIAPTDCVAVEDSPPGITSAMAAGARTLGVQHIVPVTAREGLSRAASLEQVGLDELRRIAGGEVLDLL